MSDQIQQKDINNAAWAACDTFRGVMDAAGYKDYILVMLFLKYISDVWKDHYEEYQTRYGGNDERIRRRLQNERFVLPEGSSFYDLYERRSEANVGELINIALEAIETANKEKLEGVFRNIDFNSEANLGKTRDRNRRLKMLLEDFNKPELNMSPSRVSEDVIGNTYIYLIERFASDAGKKAGEFYTPHKVSELVARLCAPKPGARICDPACGSAGLLIEAARLVGGRDYALYGMEVNGSTWALARMNMFLHGADSARIEWCNTPDLPGAGGKQPTDKVRQRGRQSAVFARQVGRRRRRRRPVQPLLARGAAQIQGRLCFYQPHGGSGVRKRGAGCSGGSARGFVPRRAAEGRIRQQLIEENLLDAVIGLPSNLFPTTSIPVAILVFDRSREQGGAHESRKDVLFVDASRDYQAGKNQNSLLDEHIEKITAAYAKREDVDKYAHLATVEEIAENDFNLNIPRYVDTFEEEEEIDIDAVGREIDQLEKELSVVRGAMGKLLQGINRGEGLGQLDRIPPL